MTSQQAPPPYYAGLENKGRDQTLDTTVMDDSGSKNALYATQNGYGYAVGNGHINNGGKNPSAAAAAAAAIDLCWHY